MADWQAIGKERDMAASGRGSAEGRVVARKAVWRKLPKLRRGCPDPRERDGLLAFWSVCAGEK